MLDHLVVVGQFVAVGEVMQAGSGEGLGAGKQQVALFGGLGFAVGVSDPTGEIDEQLALAIDR